MDVTLGRALEMALSAGVVGDELGGNPALNARLREAVNFEKVVAAGKAPAEAIEGTGARHSPGQFAARDVWRRREIDLIQVIRGGLAAFPMPPQMGVPRARAAGPRLIMIDGGRAHPAASS